MTTYSDTHWAQLVCITDEETCPKEITTSKFLIGRAKVCDWCVDSKLVSGQHCYIEKDEDSRVWLCDTSTNGTLVNMCTKVCKGQRHELKHGDEIYIVYKKDSMESNMGFIYQDCAELDREAANESWSDIEQTFVDEEVNAVDEDLTQPLDLEKGEPATKRQKTEETGLIVGGSCSEEKDAPVKGDSGMDIDASKRGPNDGKCEEGVGAKVNESSDADAVANNGVDAAVTMSGGEGVVGGGDGDEKDAMEETLMCVICQDLLYDSVSLQPCMHCFCSGCYSEWMNQSDECPSCRMKVERINKNHLINNLVDIYLKKNPDKKRSDEEIESLDAKNKITRDMLYKERPQAAVRGLDEDVGEYSDDEEDEDDDGRYGENGRYGSDALDNDLHAFGAAGYLGTYRDMRVQCRQCPGFNHPAPAHPDPQPSTSCNQGCLKTCPTPPPYVCTPDQNHVMCACCNQPMPDRRHESADDPQVAPMSCQICFGIFCHAYWGCRNMDCTGCLAKFKDMRFGITSFNGLILDNPHESGIFKMYLKREKLSLEDVFTVCLAHMEEGRFTCTNIGFRPFTPDWWVCYTCGLHRFQELAYQYRAAIPRESLPVEVTARPDCHWGKNCRTQRKIYHAQRYNHICDQIRLT